MVPPYVHILAIAALLTIPFYFFNKYLLKKLNPRESGAKLLVYFITVVVTAFAYMGAGVYLIIAVAKIIK